MKIIICAHKFSPPLIGGVDVYAYRLGCALLRLGHDPIILAFDSSAKSNNVIVSGEEISGIKVKRVRFDFEKIPKDSFDTAYDPILGTEAFHIFSAEKPDLIIIMNFYTITFAVVEAAKKINLPVVHIATDFIPVCRRSTFVRWNGKSCHTGESIKNCASCFVSENPLGRMAAWVLNHASEEKLASLASINISSDNHNILKILLPYWKQVDISYRRLKIISPLRDQIDLVLAPTRYTEEVFISNGFTKNQVYLLPFGIEPYADGSVPPKSRAAHIRFLFVGRFQPYKGAHLLVKAFNQLKNPQGSTLAIYGTFGGYDKYYNDLIKTMGENERINYYGGIDNHKLKQAFAQADYFVLPSTWHENLPLIVLDALQSQTPVIASDIGGVTDVIMDGVNGLLFPVGDLNALKEVLQRVIDDPSKRSKLVVKNNLLDIDSYTTKLLQLCSERLGC